MPHRFALILAISLMTLVGCWGPEGVPGVVRVSGTVNVDGKPVEGATVTFQPDGAARAASGRTDSYGNFKLTTLNPGDGALPGDYKVSITKVEDTDPDHHISAEELTAMITSGKKPPAGSIPGRPGSKTKNVGMKHHVPQKYSVASTSGLTAKVEQSGANSFTFELKN